MEANTEPHLLIGGSIRVLLAYGVLYGDSTLNGIHGAGEIGNETVARCVEDPASVRGDQAIDDFPVSREVRRVPTSSRPIRRL
jgi:hypothetical protein